MQAELEKWIEDLRPRFEQEMLTRGVYTVALDDGEYVEHKMAVAWLHAEIACRLLLAGKVLCDAEPVAWQVAAILDDIVHRDTFDTNGAAERYAMTDGGIVVPLYAPADMGKEGGE